MADDPRKQAILGAIAQIEKQFGKGSIMKLGDASGRPGIEVVSTGSIALDLALGVGGLPKGRIIEIYGPEASGKTTVCLHVIAQVQKNGGTAAFIDAEHALDPQRAEGIGVNLSDLLISQPDTGEQGLEIAETLIRSGAVDIVVIDSVAALVPRAEIEGDMGDSVMGLQARLMSQAMRKLTGAIARSKTMVIFTNQLREKIGVMFGNPETTTGGKALKFYASVRIDARKIDNIKGPGDQIVGSRHRFKIVKNKVAPPFRVAECDIMNEGGISYTGNLLDIGLEQGLLTKSGAFIKDLDGKIIGQGRENAKEYMATEKKFAEKLEKDIRAKFASAKTKEPEMIIGQEENEGEIDDDTE